MADIALISWIMPKPILTFGLIAVSVMLMAAGCAKKEAPAANNSQNTGNANNAADLPVANDTPAPTVVAKTVTVSFTGTAFSPASVVLNAGDSLRVVNNSDESVQPSSDPHPIHTSYSALNAKVPLAKGQSYTTAALTKKGTWGMHNHFNPTQTMSVTIK